MVGEAANERRARPHPDAVLPGERQPIDKALYAACDGDRIIKGAEGVDAHIEAAVAHFCPDGVRKTAAQQDV